MWSNAFEQEAPMDLKFGIHMRNHTSTEHAIQV